MSEIEIIFNKINESDLVFKKSKANKVFAINKLCYLLSVIDQNSNNCSDIANNKNLLVLTVLSQIHSINRAAQFPIKSTQTEYLVININFSDLCLPRLKLDSFLFIACKFDNTDLRNTTFRNCELQGCSFSGSDLSYTDFRKSRLIGCTFHQSNLKSTKGVSV